MAAKKRSEMDSPLYLLGGPGCGDCLNTPNQSRNLDRTGDRFFGVARMENIDIEMKHNIRLPLKTIGARLKVPNRNNRSRQWQLS